MEVNTHTLDPANNVGFSLIFINMKNKNESYNKSCSNLGLPQTQFRLTIIMLFNVSFQVSYIYQTCPAYPYFFQIHRWIDF